MPPKKKNGGKKAESPQPPPEIANPDEKRIFLKIIEELESRIDKYQGLCDYLTVTNTKYENELSQQISEKKDITDYLKKNLQTKGFEIYGLNVKLSALNDEKYQEKQSFEGQLRLLRQEFQETKDALSVENITLAGKLASLEEFKVQKEDILSKMNKLENEIKENETKRKEELYQLEKQNILDRHTLQKVTLHRLIDISTKFREETNRQMAETTIRSIQENTALSNDYKKLKNKCATILEENKKLKEKDTVRRINEGISQNIRNELSVKNSSLVSIVKLLTETNKCLKYRLKKISNLQNSDNQQDGVPSLAPQAEYFEAELENLKRYNAKIDSDLANLIVTDQKNQECLERHYSIFCRILKFFIRLYDFFSLKNTNSTDCEIEKEEMTHQLFLMISLINSVGIYDKESEEVFSKLKSLPHQEEEAEIKEHVFSSPETKYFHYRIGDAGIVPMESDVFVTNIKQQKSKLIGDNKTYAKYLISRLPNKRETPVNEEIS